MLRSTRLICSLLLIYSFYIYNYYFTQNLYTTCDLALSILSNKVSYDVQQCVINFMLCVNISAVFFSTVLAKCLRLVLIIKLKKCMCSNVQNAELERITIQNLKGKYKTRKHF